MVSKKPEVRHFNQKPRRKAEFIKAIQILRSKAGYGERARICCKAAGSGCLSPPCFLNEKRVFKRRNDLYHEPLLITGL